MTDRYLDGDQVNLLLSKPASSSNLQLTQSAYVSAAELEQSKYDQEVLPKSDVRSPRDEVPNFYTNMNSDLELQGYYFARHTEGEQNPQTSQEKDMIEAAGSSQLSNSYVLVKPNSSPRSDSIKASSAELKASNDIQPYEATNVTNSSNRSKSRDDTNITKSLNDIKPYESVDIKSSSTSVQSNRSSDSNDIKPYESHDVKSSSSSIKPYESTKVEGYEYNSSDSSLQSSSQQNGYYDEQQQEKDQIQGYGGYELDSLARLVLHKPSKESIDKEAESKTNEEDVEILNTITAFEDIINSEDNSDQKNLSNESQEVVGNINLFYNTEFRRLMSLPDSVRKFEQLGQLANDFVYNAETYGRIIISERTLPPESKTVKPAAMGGQAGGEKFVVRGILFKYAVDTTFAYRATPFWMYGGSTPDDERASKAGGHELLGCANIMNCNIPDLNTPLMALIDYKGYRLVAMSFLPISKGSLVYGSSDAGKSIHNDAPPLLPLMKKVGRKLNLLEHLVGSKRIIGPGDIEVHRGDDDRFYIVDFARLFPPAKPEPGTNSRAVFYEFLRPELVQSNPVPLTSDAFTAWNKLDPNVKKQEADVEAATKRLREEVIPSYAAKLADPETIKRINENWISLMILELHNEGINLRFLGRIRRQPCLENNTEAQRILVTEMVCRTLKNELRAVWRSQLNRMKLPLEQPFRKEALKILNYFADPNGNQYFWQHEIKVSLMHKYGANCLTDKEKDNNVSLYHHVQLNASHLVVRFCELTGIEVSERALDILETHQRENIAKELQIKRESDLLLPNVETKAPSEQKLNISAIFKKGIDLKLKTLKSLKGLEMNKKPCEFEFVDSDITAIKHKVKYTSFIDYATGIASLLKVMRMKDWKSNVKVEKQVSMLHHARMRFQNAISLTPNSFIYRFNLARTMLELFKRKWSQRKESICAQVFDKLKEVVNTFPDSSAVLYDWAISGFFYAYGFSRSNASVKDDVGQQARDALTKALKSSPALLNKINAHMDSWAWMLCNQFDTLMLHSPSYSSTHGLWDELHNLIVIGLQLSSTALAAAYDKELALISIRFAVHAIVYLHCLTDLRFGLEKTLPTVTYYLYTQKQRSIFNLCIKHIWDTMRQMQKTDRLLVPIYEELEAYYKEWQKIVTKPKLLKSDVSIMNAYTSSSRHLSNFDFHYNRLHYLSALFQRVIMMEHDEVQFIPPDSSIAFELLDADPGDNEKDYEEASGFIVAWMTYDWNWSDDPRLSEEEEDFFLNNIRPILTFNAENLPLYPKLREYIWMWSNIYIDFCFMQWSGTLSNRGLNLIVHLNTRFPDFSCQTLVRQLKELEPYIVEQKDLFFYWKGAQLFHSLHKLKQSKFYKDNVEYLHFFWMFFDNAIFMKQFVNELDDGEDPFSEESSCIQELVDELLKDHPEQAENILTRVKTMLDLILQTNDPLAREALGSNVYNMKLTMIVTLCICIYSAKKIDNMTMGSAIWIMHLLMTRPPFKTKISKQFDTYDIITYDAAELKAEALKKYPKVASDPRWQIPSNLHVVKFESITPNTYDGTGFMFELDDNEDDEEGMMDDIVQNSAHQKRKQKNARKGSKAQKNTKSKQK